MQKKADFPRIASRSLLLEVATKSCMGLLCGWLWACTPFPTTKKADAPSPKDGEVERVISLAPNITEIIFALGAEQKLVARSQACNYPQEALGLPSLKTYPMVDWEQIIFYEPDIVWATDELYSPDVIDLLTSRNIPLKVQSYKNLEDVFAGIEEIGESMGYSQQAEQLLDSLKKIQGNSENLYSAKPQAMIWVSDDPMVVAGGVGYMQDLLIQAGWSNVYQEGNKPYVQTTVEELLYKDPPTIFFPSSLPDHLPQVFASYPALKGLKAYQDQRIFLLDPDVIFRPGPRLFKGLKMLNSYRRQWEDEQK